MKRFIFLLVFLLVFFAKGNAQTISAGGFHSLSVCLDGTVMSWGYNSYGQLGDGTTLDKTIPKQVIGLSGVLAITGGTYHTIVLKNDSTVWAWGNNFSGQIGDGTNTERHTPVQVANLSGVIAISSGSGYSLALKDDGTVWTWGGNNYGQLGDGTKTNRYSPVQVIDLSGVVSISSHNNHSLALKEDGTVWTWGWNEHGQLGDGTSGNLSHKSIPVQVNGITDVVAIAGGNEHSIALKNNGEVWTWGRNYAGQLGDGTTINKTTPVQVSGLAGIVAITANSYSIALKNDGTVWGWGANNQGQLGDGTQIERHTPVQASSLTGIVAISASKGGGYNIVLKNDGTVWGWGFNYYGQLGDGTSNNSSMIPVKTKNLCQVKLLPKVFGLVFNDYNDNCIREVESVLKKHKLTIQPGDIVVETSNSGYWHIDSLPIGTYTITIDTTGKWRPTCDVTQTFTVTDPDGFTQAPSFGMVSTEPCSEPNVSINMPFMRPGFSGQKVYVKACNEYIATGALVNGYVDVALDELITVDAASMSYTALGNNTFRFDVGTLNPGQCVSFDMSTTVSTDAVLGQTLCMEALLYPVENCVLDTIPTPTPPDFDPCDLPWDKSSILVEGECVNDSIVFTITNTGDPGDGDMDCFSPVRLYIDGEYIWLDSIQLAGGETFTYTFAGDGRTWRLEVDQHPLHPGHSRPNATIERCGDPSNWTPDLVNTLPQDDEDPIKDIYCGIVTGSYDPNDKTGYPLGVGTDHLIEPNRKMEYVIRFQNTGTDTAFTVKILDTLDTDLDIFSVRSGVSSHNYSFRMHGPRVLEWTFYDIQLPDSTTNEPASNGFVTFTAKQNKNLPDGTEINNRVGIYFDYNDPIITNTTSHIVMRLPGFTGERKRIDLEACDEYEYKDVTYYKTGYYYRVIEATPKDTLVTLNLTIYNTEDLDLSVSQTVNTLTVAETSATYQWFVCDDTNLPLGGEQSFTPTSSGSYYVVVTKNGCADASECQSITVLGTIDTSASLSMTRIYPNPNIGSFTVAFGQQLNNATINVTDVLGKTVYTTTISGDKHNVQLTQAKGIYFVSIQTEQGERTTLKLVVE